MKPPPPPEAAKLRHRAEERLREQHPETGQALDETDTQRLVHELQVHQIELELQNEELQQARDELEVGLERYTDLYDFAPVGYVTLDREGTIHEANLASTTLLGVERAYLIKRTFGQFISADGRPAFNAFLTRVFGSKVRESCEVTLLKEGQPAAEVRIEATVVASGRECRAVLEDISERKHAEAERERVIQDLQKALAKVKLLSGLLPICASCKKIRDDQGYWNRVETYIQKHSEATFTHSLCPECGPKYFPDEP